MDKDESYENMEEAQLSHNQDLEHQEQDEENNSNHIIQVIRETNMNMLGQCIDESKNVELLVHYAEEQLMLHRHNHYACLRKAQQKMKTKREQKND
tara:strand:+ start:212 stop:499 length:288 start_codon:yes stop_codon:yes gene_type:complete